MSRIRSPALLCSLLAVLTSCDDPPSAPTSPASPLSAAQADPLLGFSGIWRYSRPLPSARAGIAADLLGTSIVVVGGGNGFWTASTRVDAFDVDTRTWRQLKSLPEPRTRLQGATTINGKLYVAGGASFNSADSVKRTLFVYDPTTDTWSRKADTPFWPCGGVQANISGKLYVYNSCDYGDFFEYSPRTDKWRALPKMQWTEAPFGSPMGDAINGKFYLTGGHDPHNRSNLLHVYDPATRTWTRKRSMPTGREGAFAVAFHGKLFVAGGLVRSSTGALSETTKVEAYDPVTDTWAEGPPLPSHRALGGSAYVGGKFYTLGGTVNGLNGVSSKVEALSTSY